MDQDDRVLGEYPAEDFMRIHVSFLSPHSGYSFHVRK